MRRIAEGAESYIYSTNFLGFEGIIKKRIKKNYRLSVLDESIRIRRTKNEARIMARLAKLGINSPSLLFLDKYDICMGRIDGTNLNRIAENTNNKKIFSKLGEYCAILHNNNISHGDFTPANVMIGDGIYLIDFGLSEITNSIEEKALDLLLMKRSISKDNFDVLIKSYKTNSKDHSMILKRLEEIEKRGRYNTRTLLAKNS